ncbi:putative inorganic phosphate cotransporter [Anticarsia gemmatalis]|uniref:putative inorganic phosphate cotransporter n=1 Tax=Anticarsia gemmatalis TaxID=129554 RepID=UPI003F76B13C
MSVKDLKILEEDVEPKKSKRKLGVRHIQVCMLFLGAVIAYSMRVNMSMAIVAMTDPASDVHFDWSIQTQSIILSSYFWGYVMLQIPSGELANRFGGMILVVSCIAVNSVVSLLIPISAYYGGWQLVCACRVLQGLTQGFLYPSIHHLIAKWVPLEEKSSMGTIIYAGAQLGTALQLMSSGFIADYLGWPAIFYVNGILGSVWNVAYMFLGADSPQTSRMISEEERLYIQTSLGHIGGHKKLRTPWKSLWTSLPFISLIIASCGFNWGFWTLMTEIPTYMKQVMGVDIKSNGIISALPYLAMYLMSFPFGFATDYILKKKWLSITACRKWSNSIGHFGPAIALITLALVPVDIIMAIVLLTVAVGINAGAYTGFLLVHLDMAPNFAATMMGITNSLSSLVSILAPLAAGALIQDETEPLEWRKVFFLSSGVYIACNLFYVIFGSSERQKWNEPDDVANKTIDTDINVDDSSV